MIITPGFLVIVPPMMLKVTIKWQSFCNVSIKHLARIRVWDMVSFG